MINFKNYLAEARNYPIYHATEFVNLLQILNTGMIMGNTEHDHSNLLLPHEKAGAYGYYSGVSTTRSYKFAHGWSEVVIELDHQSIANNFKILPINFFQSNREGYSEFEEFILTAKNKGIPIKFIKRVFLKETLKHTVISKEVFDALEKHKIPYKFIPLSTIAAKIIPKKVLA